MSVGIDNYPYASGDRDPTNAGNIGIALRPFSADADTTGFACYARITNVDIVIAGSEIAAGGKAEGDVEVSSRIISECVDPVSRVIGAGRVMCERSTPIGHVEVAGRVL